MIKNKSKHLNFILNLYINKKIKLDINKVYKFNYDVITHVSKVGSFKSFKILINVYLNKKITFKTNFITIF